MYQNDKAMNANVILSTVCYCASTTTSELQNAKNALEKLQGMRKAIGFSFGLYRAIKIQKKLIADMENSLSRM
jgi:hypothetical protein